MKKPPSPGVARGVRVVRGGYTQERQLCWVPPFFLASGPRTAGSLTGLGRLPSMGFW